MPLENDEGQERRRTENFNSCKMEIKMVLAFMDKSCYYNFIYIEAKMGRSCGFIFREPPAGERR